MVTQLLAAGLSKSLMWLKSSLFFWLCTDTYYKMKPRPAMPGTPLKVKTIVLIRHGESIWNYGFNNPAGFSILRVFKLLLSEISIFMKHDSYFLDSPLSQAGVNQAVGLRSYLSNTQATYDMYINILKTGKAMILSSNLRRAITTTIISLYDRLENSTEKIHTMSNMQEITRNVDSFCITPAGCSPISSQLELTLKKKIGVDMPEFLARRIQADAHKGTKGIFSNGEIRIKKFIASLFEKSEENFIVGGHSLFFKEIFKGYLPKESKHDGKKLKMANGAAVGLQIGEFKDDEGKAVYQINEQTVQIIYLGFVKKKKMTIAPDTIVCGILVVGCAWKFFFSR